jgi:hypothetical protein
MSYRTSRILRIFSYLTIGGDPVFVGLFLMIIALIITLICRPG